MNALLACVLTVSAVDVNVKTLAEQQISGRLAHVTADSVVIVTADGDKTFSTADLLSVTPKEVAREALAARITVRLLDGSVLRSVSYMTADSTATIKLVGGGQVQLPTGTIHSVLLKSHEDSPEIHQKWESLWGEELLGDRIVTRKTTDGETTLKAHDGVLFDIGLDTVHFKFQGELIPVRREKVEGILYFHPAGRKLPKAICRVVDIDGSVWNVKALRSLNNELGLITSTGAEFTLPLDRLREFDFSVGKVSYLSDLEPESVKWSPFIGSPTTSKTLEQIYYPQMDKAFSGEPLQLFSSRKFPDGLFKSHTKEFSKGLAVHSRTLLIYRLPGDYTRFIATAGIDPRVRDGGNVRLQISGDGKILFDGAVTGKDPEPLELDVDITGVHRLRILVDYGDQTDIADYLHLCNAKVTK